MWLAPRQRLDCEHSTSNEDREARQRERAGKKERWIAGVGIADRGQQDNRKNDTEDYVSGKEPESPAVISRSTLAFRKT
jgi:hypothetical protein